MINNLNFFFLGPVDPGQVRQHLELQVGIIAQKTTDLDDGLAIDQYVRLRNVSLEVANLARKLLFQPGVDFFGVHAYAWAASSAGRDGFTSQRSRIILSWMRNSPSVSASGRGGHPGT